MRLNIDRVATIASTLPSESAVSSGTIMDATTRLLIAAGIGTIEVLELQPAGKRSMPVAEFLRGYRPASGEAFGPSDRSV